MAALIREGIAVVASLVVCIIAYTTFGPLVSDILASYVMDALVNPGTTALAVNGNALLLTKDIILMGMKVFLWFVCFAILARFFLYVGFKSQDQAVM